MQVATTFAVLQMTLDVPPIDLLQRAFRRTNFLAPFDAFSIANDAFGILLNHARREQAYSLQDALRAEGLETEVVAEADLVPLPTRKFTNRIDCTPDALMIYDPIGRPFAVEWRHIMLVAAGNVMVTELTRVGRELPPTDRENYGWGVPNVTREYSTKEERTLRFMLDIVITRAVLIYSLNITSRIPFQYLGDRATLNLSENASLVMQDFAAFAPQTTFNRGAFYYRENMRDALTYPSKNAFLEETIWMLWQMKKAGRI